MGITIIITVGTTGAAASGIVTATITMATIITGGTTITATIITIIAATIAIITATVATRRTQRCKPKARRQPLRAFLHRPC